MRDDLPCSGYLLDYLFIAVAMFATIWNIGALRAFIAPAFAKDHGIRGRSVERSLRRALRGLIGDGKMGAVIAFGEGGPADPHRYAYNPIWAALAGNEEGYQRLCAIAQAGRSSIAAR